MAKIRSGFVSNSSSTSFMIYGVSMDMSELQSLLNGGPSNETFDDDESGYELVEKLDGKDGLTAYTSEGEYAYIGVSWDSVGDNETGKQFKERVQGIIAKNIGPNLKCSTISETVDN